MKESLVPEIEGFLSDVDLGFFRVSPEKRNFRDKVRTAVRKKAREISDSIQTSRPIPSIVLTTRIQEYFKKIGLEEVGEFKFEEDSFTVLIMPGLVVEVNNDAAEKILVLGLP